MTTRGRWNERLARGLSGPALCAYASRLIGADPRLVLWGGGNSSVKTVEEDHAGRSLRVLWVKASGYDMKSIGPEGFTPLRLDELRLLRAREAMTDEEMVAYQLRCQLDPKAAKPSIETLLHAFVDAPHVYHTHADAAAGFTCAPRSRERALAAFGDGVLWLPYLRPGFELSKRVAAAVEAAPKAWAMILDKHGALSWGETARKAYEAMLRLVRGAASARPLRGDRPEWGSVRMSIPSAAQRRAAALEIAPWLRGLVGRRDRMIVRWTDEPPVLDYLSRPETAAISRRGAFTMDHSLQTKARPLYWRRGPRASLARAVEAYVRWYDGYQDRHLPPGAGRMDPHPRVLLVPGVGLFTTGKDWGAAGVSQEISLHTAEVVLKVAGFARYAPLDLRRLGGVEFWPMELYKARLAPPEKEFSRKVVLVTGAAGAIGSETARRFCESGAHVVLTDIDGDAARRAAEGLSREFGAGRALAARMDVTDERSVRAGFEAAVLAYGGLDVLFSNAGIAKSAPVERLELADWRASMEVNATGGFLAAREAMRLFSAQGVGGAVVFNASKNVLAPGKEFAAYSASKAALTQLARVLALEGAERGVRVNIVNPDAVFEGSGLWSPEVRRQRARAQGIAVSRIEDYYISRNLLKAKVTARDVAEAVVFLASERSAKTTGALLPVDGGLREAFPR